jgi:hypothetical protein
LLDAGQLRLLQKELGATERILITFPAEDGVEAAKATLAHMRETIKGASAHPPGMILLTDRGVGTQQVALPALLGVGRGWKAMVEAGLQDVPTGDRKRAGDRYPSRRPAGGGGRAARFSPTWHWNRRRISNRVARLRIAARWKKGCAR